MTLVFNDTMHINNAQIIIADILALGGVIHLVNSVILPFWTDEDDILSVARKEDELSTFVVALSVTGLHERLALNGTFTLFGPTNSAFEKMLDYISDYQYLKELLLYHIAPRTLLFDDLKDGTLQMIEGDKIKVDRQRSRFYQVTPTVVINGGEATVISKDLISSNGVVHTIDGVLIPPNDLVDRVNAI